MTENFKVEKELTRLYHQDTFLFGKKTLFQKLKAQLAFYGKKIMTNTPFAYVNHKFINTITVLAEAENKALNIF